MHAIQAYQTSILDLQNRLLSQNPGQSNHSGERTTDVNLSTKKNIDISIITAEGDRVTLSAKSGASGTYTTYNSTGLLSSLEDSSLSLSTSREISLLVEGDLSEEEMEDIEEFLNKINSIAKKLFKGDLDKAISKAMNIGDFNTIESLEAHIQYETSSSVSVQHSGMAGVSVDPSSSEESGLPDPPEPTNPMESYLKSSENKGSLTITQDGMSKNVSAQTEFEETTTTKENGGVVNLVDLARSYEYASSLIIEPPEPHEGLIDHEDSEESSIVEADPEENSKVDNPVPQNPEEVTVLEPVDTNNAPVNSVTQEESEGETTVGVSETQDVETTVQSLSNERTINVTIQANITTSAQIQTSEEPITMASLKETFESMAKEVDKFGRKGHRAGRKLSRIMNHHFDRMSRSHHGHGPKMKLFQMMKKALMEKVQEMFQFNINIQILTGSTQQTGGSQPDSSQQPDNSKNGNSLSDQGQPSQSPPGAPQLTPDEIESIDSTTPLFEGYSTAQYRVHTVTSSTSENEDSAGEALQPKDETLEVIA